MRSNVRDSFQFVGSIDDHIKATQLHFITIAVNQLNLDVLEQLLHERSDPTSSLYQQWLSFDDIGSYIINDMARMEIEAWISTIPDSKIIWTSSRHEYIEVSAPIKQWEIALATEFYVWEERDTSNRAMLLQTHRREGLSDEPSYQHILAKEYHLPYHIHDHIVGIFNIIEIPPILQPSSHMNEAELLDTTQKIPRSSIANDAVTLASLNQLYHIPSNQGDSRLIQAVFETSNEYYSVRDIEIFENTFDVELVTPIETGSKSYNVDLKTNSVCITPNTTYPTSIKQVSCYEGNLDLQYIMALAQETQTRYAYVGSNNPFLTWILQVSSDPNPPSVNSISWITIEHDFNALSMNSFNTEAIKLSLLGVTIIASTGDNGVASRNGAGTCKCSTDSSTIHTEWAGSNSWTGKGYFPLFPASSPFVTSVGATMGPNRMQEEIACQADQGGVITSGGGFSGNFPIPSWQVDAINQYFSNQTSNKLQTPTAGYNRLGRGYPDVSFIGVKYATIVNSKLVYLYGTSASAPLFAAMISLINADRLRANLPTVGFINPSLYAAGYNRTINNVPFKNMFTDITKGRNNCCTKSKVTDCCEAGFNTTVGWDPVTGWGSVNYTALATMLSNPLSENTITYRPTSAPALIDGDPSDVSSSSPSLTKSLSLIEIIILMLGGIGFLITSMLSYFYIKVYDKNEGPSERALQAVHEPRSARRAPQSATTPRVTTHIYDTAVRL